MDESEVEERMRYEAREAGIQSKQKEKSKIYQCHHLDENF